MAHHLAPATTAINNPLWAYFDSGTEPRVGFQHSAFVHCRAKMSGVVLSFSAPTGTDSRT
jgi:hypothetical protein